MLESLMWSSDGVLSNSRKSLKKKVSHSTPHLEEVIVSTERKAHLQLVLIIVLKMCLGTWVVIECLVGDEEFPLKHHLMRPHPGQNLEREERIYNYRRSRAHNCVKCIWAGRESCECHLHTAEPKYIMYIK